MGRYDRQIKTVKNAIAKAGQPVLVKTQSGVTATIPMLFLSPSVRGESQLTRELLQYLSGTSVASGELRGYSGAFSFKPCLTDIVIRDGKELTIKAVDTFAPNGQVIFHTFEFAL